MITIEYVIKSHNKTEEILTRKINIDDCGVNMTDYEYIEEFFNKMWLNRLEDLISFKLFSKEYIIKDDEEDKIMLLYDSILIEKMLRVNEEKVYSLYHELIQARKKLHEINTKKND